ncbi:MAG: hypothetical protein IKU65_06450 [Oscillospiraceae bacterium]|nr:hypothetical protein [Oscillospiraceae bacterium]
MAAKKTRKKRLSGRFAIFFTILLIVCTVLFLNNRVTSGSLRRLAYLIFSGVRADATETTVNFDENDYNRFFVHSGNLCVLSPEKLSVYKISGNTSFSSPILLRNPAVTSGSSRFLAYDLGGLNYYVFTKDKLLTSGTSSTKIISANMNKSGNFAIVTDGDNSKNLVTVYNTSFEPIFKFHSTEKHVFDAAVSPSGKTLAVITYGASEGQFESALALCKTDSDGFFSTFSLGNSTPLKLSFLSESRVLLVCDNKTLLFSNDGSLLSEISHKGLPVKSLSSITEKHIAILLDNYQNGGNSKVLLLRNNGDLIGELDFDEDIFSVSTAGNYISLQFSNRCTVYKNDLTVVSEFEIPTSVSRCIVSKDGSVLSISNNSATLFVK